MNAVIVNAECLARLHIRTMNGERKRVYDAAFSRVTHAADERPVVLAVVAKAEIRIAKPLLPRSLRIVPSPCVVQLPERTCRQVDYPRRTLLAWKRRMRDVVHFEREREVTLCIRLHKVVKAEEMMLRSARNSFYNETHSTPSFP